MLLRFWDLANDQIKATAHEDIKKELWVAMRQALLTRQSLEHPHNQDLITKRFEMTTRAWMIEALRTHQLQALEQRITARSNQRQQQSAAQPPAQPPATTPAEPSSATPAVAPSSQTPVAPATPTDPPRPLPTREQRRAYIMASLKNNRAVMDPYETQFGAPSETSAATPPVKRRADQVLELEERVAKKLQVGKKPLFEWKGIENCKLERAIFSTGDNDVWVGHLSEGTTNPKVQLAIWCGRYGRCEIHLTTTISKMVPALEEGAPAEKVVKKFTVKVRSQYIPPESLRGYFYTPDVENRMVIPANQLQNVKAAEVFCVELALTDAYVNEAVNQWALKEDPAGFCDGDLTSVKESVRRLFVSGTTLRCAVRLKNPATFMDKGWATFSRFVKEQMPRYPQYLNDEGEVEYDPLVAERITRVGDNMYLKKPALKDQQGRPREAEYFRFARDLAYTKVDDLENPARIGHMREQQVVEQKREDLLKNFHVAGIVDLNIAKGKGADAQRLSLADAAMNKGIQSYRRVYCQLATDSDGHKAAVPVEGERIGLDFGKDPGNVKAWEPVDEKDRWDGVVVSTNADLLHNAQADFCVVAKVPESDVEMPPQDKLIPVRIHLEVDRTAAQREREALARFFRGRKTKLVSATHQAMEDLTLETQREENLSSLLAGLEGGSPEQRVARLGKSESIIQGLEGDQSLNASQAKSIRQMGRLLHRMGLIRGPPGTGKTLTLSHAALVLHEAGHRILITGTTNNCVDDNTNKLVDLVAKWIRDNRGWGTMPIILRLERGSEQSLSEKAVLAMMAELGVAGVPDAITLQNLVQLQIQARKQGDELAAKFEDAIDERVADEIDLLLGDDLGDSADAVKEAMRKTPIVAAREAAEGVRDQYVAAARLIGNPKSIPVVTTLYYNTEYMVQTIINCVETIGEEVYARHGGLLDRYVEVKAFVRLREMLRSGQKLKRKDEVTLAAISWRIKSATVNAANIVLTTNNIAATTLARKFEPTVLFQDEGALATFAASVVPPACYPSLEGWTIFADEKQLNAMAVSEHVNEFVDAYTWSVFTLLLERHFPPTTLDVEHRYPEEICQWISEYYYGGILKPSHAKVNQPGMDTDQVRLWTYDRFGIEREPDKVGSAFIGIDVRYGHHVTEANGRSLQNYANAQTGLKHVKDLYEVGIAPADVVYLVFYKGQRRLVQKAFTDAGVNLPGKILTVDKFQGQEGAVVILDTVVGSVLTYTELKKGVGRASAHATKPARLNVRITRAVEACVVIYNGDYIARYAQGTALAAMVEYLENRNFVVDETDIKDAHPLLAQARHKHHALFTTTKCKMPKKARLEMIAQGKGQKQVYDTTVDMRNFTLDVGALL